MSRRDNSGSGSTSPLGYFLTFTCTLLVARIVVDLVQHQTQPGFQAWLTPSTWIVPAGFALIACFSYWYRSR